MEFNVYDVVPELSMRSELGRVVVNPPDRREPLRCTVTGKIYMCCNRAFLTEKAIKAHLESFEDHEKAIDFKKFRPTLKHIAIKDDTSPNGTPSVKKRKKQNNTDKSSINKNKDPVTPSSDDTTGESVKYKVCEICYQKISRTNFRRHMQTAHAPNGIKCEHCPCTYLSRVNLLRHKREQHGIFKRKPTTAVKPAFKQTAIAKAKKQLSASANPKIVFTTDKSKYWVCPKCDKSFPTSQRYEDHMNSHTGSRPHRCPQCKYGFSHLSNLKRHLKTAHPSSTTHRCNKCNCNFSHGSFLARHNKVMHPTQLRIKKLRSPVKQEVEDSVQMEPSNYKESENVTPVSNTAQKPPERNSAGFYVCTICNKELVSAQTWTGHMRIHQNVKPYKCKLCGISFRLHSTRRNHINVAHSGGAFKCEHCSCCYNSARARDDHMKRHVEQNKGTEKPKVETPSTKTKVEDTKTNQTPPIKAEPISGFKCNLCGAVVRTLEEFELHKKEHSGSLPSQCNLCLAKFASPINAKNHKKRAHGDASVSVHRCSFCCCRYITSSSLFQHLSKQHAMSSDDWDYDKKSMKPEARQRIQLRLCKIDRKRDTPAPESPIKSQVDTKKQEETKISDAADTSSSSSKPYKCDLCPCRFLLFRSIKGHKKIAHANGKFRCSQCCCRFVTHHRLKRHEGIIHSSATHDDSKSEIVVPPTESKSPKAPNAVTEKFHCPECSRSFEAQRGLDVHRSAVHGYIGKKHRLKALIQQRKIAAVESNSKLANGKFECNLCHLQFCSSSSVGVHKKKSHLNAGKFKCSKCPCTFINIRSLTNHKKHHNRISLLKNKQQKARVPVSTKEISPTKSGLDGGDTQLTDHRTNVKARVGGRVQCAKCNLMVIRKNLSSHRKRSHGGGDHKCTYCSCEFQTVGGMKKHITIHHTKGNVNEGKDQETVEANSSAKSFSGFNKNFLKIRNMFTTTKKIAASIPTSPAKKSPVKVILPVNKKTNTPPQTYSPTKMAKHTCTKCGIMFAEGGNYKRHLERAHVEGGIPCTLCKCSFAHSGSLAAHNRVYHSSQKPKSARRHQRNSPRSPSKSKSIRNEDVSKKPTPSRVVKPVEMESNESTKQVYSEIRTRLRTTVSPDEKAGKEGVTGEAAIVEENGKSSAEAKYTCSWCLKAFDNLKVLNRHILSHTKPEICDQCNMGFRDKNELVQHQQNAHKEDSKFQCHICSCRFATYVGMRSHMTKCHGKGSDTFNADIVIESDVGVLEDNHRLISVDQGYARQTHADGSNGFDEESEPIVQGLFYGDEDGEFDNSVNHAATANGMQDDDEIYEDSVPIITGVREISDEETTPGVRILPNVQVRKPTFTPKSRPMKCPVCSETCFGPENLRIHVESHEGHNVETNIKIKCQKCSYEFDSNEEMAEHLEMEHSGMYKCAYCPCSMKTEPSLRSHFVKYHT